MILPPHVEFIQDGCECSAYGRHRYHLRTRPAPGIGGVIRAGGWLQDMPDDTAAMHRGVVIHSAINLDNKGKLDEAHFRATWPDWIGYLEASRKAKRELGIEFDPDHSEWLVGSEEGYATKIDLVGVITHVPVWSKRWAVINWKTSTSGNLLDWPHYPIQAAGEALMFDEPVHRIGIALTPEGRYSAHEWTDRHDLAEFRRCLAKFHHERKAKVTA